MAKRLLWHRPILRTDEEESKHRDVTWLELFFDLVFVVVIARLSHNLTKDISVHGILTFLYMFVPVWWIWIGITYYTERFESEGLETRLVAFLTMLAVAGLAVFSHHGLAENYVGFVTCFLAARWINIIMWLRGGIHNPVFRPISIRFATGTGLATIIVLLSFALDGPAKMGVWGLALIIEVATPSFTTKLQAQMPKLSTSKLPERYGLFTIIVLGESIVGTVSGLAEHGHFTAMILTRGALGLTMGFALWWIYFDFVARRPARHSRYAPFLWSYYHLPLMAAVAATGAAVLACVEAHGHQLGDGPRWLIFGSVALALMSIGLLETTLQRTKHEPTHPGWSPALKILTGAVLLLVAWLGHSLAPIPIFVILLAALAIQIIYGVVTWFGQELPENSLQ